MSWIDFIVVKVCSFRPAKLNKFLFLNSIFPVINKIKLSFILFLNFQIYQN